MRSPAYLCKSVANPSVEPMLHRRMNGCLSELYIYELHSNVMGLYLQLDEMKATVEGLEKERDFYFGKLRDIEVLCQEREGEEFTTGILNILYATEVSNIILIRNGRFV